MLFSGPPSLNLVFQALGPGGVASDQCKKKKKNSTAMPRFSSRIRALPLLEPSSKQHQHPTSRSSVMLTTCYNMSDTTHQHFSHLVFIPCFLQLSFGAYAARPLASRNPLPWGFFSSHPPLPSYRIERRRFCHGIWAAKSPVSQEEFNQVT